MKLQSMFMLLLNVFLVVWPFDLEFQNALKRKTGGKNQINSKRPIRNNIFSSRIK